MHIRAAQPGKAHLAARTPWDWQEAAACRGEDTVLFFGSEGERVGEKKTREKKAADLCESCPVRTECLDYAIDKPEKYGWWGGLDEDERANERRRRMRRVNAS